MQTEHSPFPTDETLAAYIDGRLDEETRKRVVEHMAECPECLDVVMGGREIETIGNSKILAAHSTSRWVLRTLAAVAAALAAVVFLTPLRQTFLQHRPSGRDRQYDQRGGTETTLRRELACAWRRVSPLGQCRRRRADARESCDSGHEAGNGAGCAERVGRRRPTERSWHGVFGALRLGTSSFRPDECAQLRGTFVASAALGIECMESCSRCRETATPDARRDSVA